MNFKNSILLLLLIGLAFTACKEETYLYEVSKNEVSPATADKQKSKTPEQYISILYANLFQKALGVDELLDITDLIYSIGDKDLAHEQVISNFMNSDVVILPSDESLRSAPIEFVMDTYERFFVREPNELEKEYWVNYIESHPDVTVELIYFAFAISNEYRYY